MAGVVLDEREPERRDGEDFAQAPLQKRVFRSESGYRSS